MLSLHTASKILNLSPSIVCLLAIDVLQMPSVFEHGFVWEMKADSWKVQGWGWDMKNPVTTVNWIGEQNEAISW